MRDYDVLPILPLTGILFRLASVLPHIHYAAQAGSNDSQKVLFKYV